MVELVGEFNESTSSSLWSQSSGRENERAIAFLDSGVHVGVQVALTSDETRCSEEAMAPLNASSKQACKRGAVALGGWRQRRSNDLL